MSRLTGQLLGDASFQGQAFDSDRAAPPTSFSGRVQCPPRQTAVGLRMTNTADSQLTGLAQIHLAPEVEVVIEIPRGSFLKRGSTGRIDFVSPLPCPYNYGSVPSYVGLEGDLLDAVVLGPRLPAGTRVKVRAWGSVSLMDRGMSDDKLICSDGPVSELELQRVLRFFHFYARCKALLNRWRRRPGRNACDGLGEAREALARARPRDSTWRGPPVDF